MPSDPAPAVFMRYGDAFPALSILTIVLDSSCASSTLPSGNATMPSALLPSTCQIRFHCSPDGITFEMAGMVTLSRTMTGIPPPFRKGFGGAGADADHGPINPPEHPVGTWAEAAGLNRMVIAVMPGPNTP